MPGDIVPESTPWAPIQSTATMLPKMSVMAMPVSVARARIAEREAANASSTDPEKRCVAVCSLLKACRVRVAAIVSLA